MNYTISLQYTHKPTTLGDYIIEKYTIYYFNKLYRVKFFSRGTPIIKAN